MTEQQQQGHQQDELNEQQQREAAEAREQAGDTGPVVSPTPEHRQEDAAAAERGAQQRAQRGVAGRLEGK